jgi:hypothetical protein
LLLFLFLFLFLLLLLLSLSLTLWHYQLLGCEEESVNRSQTEVKQL